MNRNEKFFSREKDIELNYSDGKADISNPSKFNEYLYIEKSNESKKFY